MTITVDVKSTKVKRNQVPNKSVLFQPLRLCYPKCVCVCVSTRKRHETDFDRFLQT